MTKTIVVMGTMDTKGLELAYLAQQVSLGGCHPLLMDVGAQAASDTDADITAAQVAAVIGEDIDTIRALPRGEAVEKMVAAASVYLKKMVQSGEAHGVIGVGGSGGTTICAAAMRALPYGVPKFMVSTLASGNTRWHVDIADIIMIPSLLDIGGLNPMLEMVLNNAAQGIAGMVKGHYAYQASGKKVISMTMYGTTTPGVSRARQVVDDAGFETWVFHASGVGGRTMEELMSMGRIHAVMDMTLAEVGAHLVGGLHDAGPLRLEMAAQLGLPQVIVPGAADTIVLPPRDQVPEKFKNRTLNFHNPTMTTMRTSGEENVAIAEFIANKLNQAKGPVVVVLPLGGLSSIDRPDKIFYDPEANGALFETLKKKLSSGIELIEDEHHLDDPEFAIRVGQKMVSLLNR
ncbi:MAG: Tm-1-like ATP-binding domain-containing protein [Desulfobacterales bacterium]|nr:Tm-1-like ATP-binding domain-containing protein [Desulfobacterales bacterium]